MWQRHVYCGEEDGSGEGGGAGGAGGEGGDENKPDAAEELRAQVGVLTKAVTLMAQGHQATQAQITELAQAIAAGGNRKDDDGDGQRKSADSGDLFDGVDVEALDRKEYGTLLLTKFMERLGAHMDEKLKPVLGKVGSLEQTLSSDMGARQISDVVKDNADLYEWKEELAAAMKDAPGLSLKRALAIVRSENPKKNAEMVKKYKSSGGDGEKKRTFLSLTPTSRTGDSDAKGGKMKFHEAAESAFDDVLASLGAGSFEELTGGARR